MLLSVTNLLLITGGIVALYVAITFLLAPEMWKRYFRRHPSLAASPRVTHTKDGHPGDPLNVALTGSQADIERVMTAAHWVAAKPLGLWSDMHIAEATILKRPDPSAPVSSLYLFDRKEDLAFELPVGDNPRQRNHVRFWQTETADRDGRPIWLGAATLDERVGFSHTTGQITHHIDGDIDAERDRLLAALSATGLLSETYFIDDFHQNRQGTNGGGDPWHTDGRLRVGVITAN